SDLFIINLSNGVRTPFTFDSAGYSFPIWSPDDQFIDFGAPSSKTSVASVDRKPSNGAGAIEQIFPDEKVPMVPFDRSRDGLLIYVVPRAFTGDNVPGVTGDVNLWMRSSSGDPTPFRLASTPEDKRLAKFSPDGRWVAYVSTANVWVVPVVRPTGAGDVKFHI